MSPCGAKGYVPTASVTPVNIPSPCAISCIITVTKSMRFAGVAPSMPKYQGVDGTEFSTIEIWALLDAPGQFALPVN